MMNFGILSFRLNTYCSGLLSRISSLAGFCEYNENAEKLDSGWLHGFAGAALPQRRTGLHGAAQWSGSSKNKGNIAVCNWRVSAAAFQVNVDRH